VEEIAPTRCARISRVATTFDAEEIMPLKGTAATIFPVTELTQFMPPEIRGAMIFISPEIEDVLEIEPLNGTVVDVMSP
jgi:hypothetical protein